MSYSLISAFFEKQHQLDQQYELAEVESILILNVIIIFLLFFCLSSILQTNSDLAAKH